MTKSRLGFLVLPEGGKDFDGQPVSGVPRRVPGAAPAERPTSDAVHIAAQRRDPSYQVSQLVHTLYPS